MLSQAGLSKDDFSKADSTFMKVYIATCVCESACTLYSITFWYVICDSTTLCVYSFV